MKEFYYIKIRQVWSKVQVDSPVQKFRLKWVFKLRNDGRYRDSLCVLGYRQVSGYDFTDIHSPVIKEMTIRAMIILAILTNINVKKIDIEASFMEGRLQETIYVKTSSLMNEKS